MIASNWFGGYAMSRFGCCGAVESSSAMAAAEGTKWMQTWAPGDCSVEAAVSSNARQDGVEPRMNDRSCCLGRPICTHRVW